ncbi:MAG: SPOR domain-containing protein [Prevotellaceae bacterium]|jgi:hypothetical protein|nr:SPOR domain-containing protein [Prevotellaceae bacterium]
MNDFDELLYRLIQNNRRVIIPDIGAFITNVPDENTVFSPLLKYNDGFLEDELQKEGIANPAGFLRELAENIISVVERGRHYHIAGLGYFCKDESIRFVFEETDKDADSESDAGLPGEKEKKGKLRLVSALICLCLTLIVFLSFVVFDIYGSKKLPDMFTSQKEKPAGQFVIVDKSGDCDAADSLDPFPQATGYHLVVACFEEKDNAEKFVLQCRKIGYDKAELLSVTNVLYTVSIGAFASRDEATEKKQEYDSRFGDNTMILKLNDFK